MATVVNTPGGPSESGGGMGFFMGMLLLVVVVVLFLIFGVPMLRSGNITTRQEINMPDQTEEQTPQINIPDQIDVNIQPPATGTN